MGSGRAAASPGAATRGLDARFGAAWCSSGMVTLISGSGIAPGMVGDALGVAEGTDAAPALPDGSAAGGDVGGADSAGLAGSAAPAGFSSVGWPYPGTNDAADSSSPTANDDVKRDIFFQPSLIVKRNAARMPVTSNVRRTRATFLRARERSGPADLTDDAKSSGSAGDSRAVRWSALVMTRRGCERDRQVARIRLSNRAYEE